MFESRAWPQNKSALLQIRYPENIYDFLFISRITIGPHRGVSAYNVLVWSLTASISLSKHSTEYSESVRAANIFKTKLCTLQVRFRQNFDNFWFILSKTLTRIAANQHSMRSYDRAQLV